MFLPDIAWLQADGTVNATVQAWVYRKQRRRGVTRLLALFLGINTAALGEDGRRRLYERTQLFRVVSVPGKRLYIRDGRGQLQALPETDSDGRASWHLLSDRALLRQNGCKALSFQLDPCSGIPAESNSCMAFYAPPTGVSIISDMDDTIKETCVDNTRTMLSKTFLEEFKPVTGICEWYSHMAGSGNVAFHYVTASPVQLYPALQDFMQRNILPEGSIHLREATGLINMIPRTKAVNAHKNRVIERLLHTYPQRRFILIGDSGGNDPAIYADMMRRHPQQISQIVIRDKATRKPQPYTTIFRDIAPDKWLVTSDVAQMRAFIQF